MSEAQTLAVGTVGVFKGYEALEKDQEAILDKGEKVKILEVVEDDAGGVSYTVQQLDGEQGDTIFDSEFIPEAPARSRTKTAKANGAAGKTAAKPRASGGTAKATGGKAPSLKSKAGTKSTAKSEAAKEVEVPEIIDTDAVAERLKDGDALEAAKALVNQVEETYFTLGGVLSHIMHEGLHKSAGYTEKNGFSEFCVNELGMEYRKARYLITIYSKFTMLGVDETKLSAIGWSKAAKIAAIQDDAKLEKNFDKLVTYAAKHTREELESHITKNYVKKTRGGEAGATGSKTKKVKFVFSLFGDQASVVEDALNSAKSEEEGASLSDAFNHIVTEWAMLTEQAEPKLEDAIDAVELRYGVRLQVLEEEAEAEE